MKKNHTAIFAVLFAMLALTLTGCASVGGKLNDMTTLPLSYKSHEVVQAKVIRVYTNLEEKHKWITNFDTYFPDQYKNDVMAKVVLSNFAFLVVRFTTAIVPPGMTLHKGAYSGAS